MGNSNVCDKSDAHTLRFIVTLLLVCFIGALAACAVLDKDTPGWPEFQQRTRNAGVRLHSEEYGRGEPIVFLHGLGLSTYSWRHLVGPLARHYRAILLDLKGFGNSPKPLDQEYTLYDQATPGLSIHRRT